jgi:hypothetical protein
MSTTANPQRGEVEITLDKPRILRLTTNSLARAEKLLDGKSLLDRSVVLSWDAIRVLLFVGLNDPKLTLDKIGDLVDEADKDKVLMAVYAAWSLHLGRGAKTPEEGEAVEGVDPQSASAGIGKDI